MFIYGCLRGTLLQLLSTFQFLLRERRKALEVSPPPPHPPPAIDLLLSLRLSLSLSGIHFVLADDSSPIAMPRYYCDYCDTYLTHDSPSVRKQHNAGYKHKANVRTYYQQFEEQQTQSLIDQRIKEHLGQAAAFQVGATFQQHLAARPRLPILPTPVLPVPGIRPPVLPTPVPGAPGYGAPPMPQPGMPPVASSMPPVLSSVPPQMPGMPRPPINLPTAPGAAVATSSTPTAMTNPAPYQIGAVPTSGAISGNPSVSAPQVFSAGGPTAAAVTNTPQDGFPYSQKTPEPGQ